MQGRDVPARLLADCSDNPSAQPFLGKHGDFKTSKYCDTKHPLKFRLHGKTLLYTISLFLNSKMMLFWQRVPFLQIYLEPRFQVSQKILLLATLVWTTADLLWYFTVRHSSSFFPLSIHFYFSLYLKWSKSTLSNNPKGIALVFAKRFASTLRWDSFFEFSLFLLHFSVSDWHFHHTLLKSRERWIESCDDCVQRLCSLFLCLHISEIRLAIKCIKIDCQCLCSHTAHTLSNPTTPNHPIFCHPRIEIEPFSGAAKWSH